MEQYGERIHHWGDGGWFEQSVCGRHWRRLQLSLKPGTHQANVRQFFFVGWLCFLSLFYTVGWSWSLSAFFRPIPHVELASELIVQSGIWSFLLAVQLVNQCTRKAQNGRNTWLSGVERWLGVSVQLWTQMLPAWADHTVCVLDLRSKRAVCANNVSSGLHCICSYMYKVVILLFIWL